MARPLHSLEAMRLSPLTTAALLVFTACSTSATDRSNDPESLDPAKPVALDPEPAPMNEMDPEPAPMTDADGEPASKPKHSARDPFVAPELNAACGWDRPTIYFSTDSAKIGLVGDVKVDLLVTCLNSDPLADDPIAIYGYADERGTEAHNRALGLERANAVKADLVEAGVDASRIATYSRGEYFVDDDGEHQDDRRVLVKMDE